MECLRGYELGPISFDEYTEPLPDIFLKMVFGDAESKRIGTHNGEDGQERGVWQHVFTPPEPEASPFLRFANGAELSFSAITTLQSELQRNTPLWTFTISGKMNNTLLRLWSQARHQARLRKLKQRQRRHAHRKHCQGRTYHK